MTTVAQPSTRGRSVGFGLAVLGVVVATIALIVNIVAGNDIESSDPASALAASFGLTVLGFATIKVGIAAVLTAILLALRGRLAATKAALPLLRGSSVEDRPAGSGVDISDTPPPKLAIHKMAERMWRPMLAMGVMAVAVGFIVSIVWANADSDSVRTAAAWTQGLMFLGEGFLLAGISFLLGTILSELRSAGSEVQEALGLRIQTLRMPGTGKAFIAVMMLGVMLAVTQFVLYLVVAGLDSAQSAASWFAWLGPLREWSLGLLLIGIGLALATIGRALNFQFARLTQIVKG